jgi:hypothetical protein
MRRGVGLYSCFGGGLPGNRGTAAGFAMADDANRITARQTTETGEAAIPRADIERFDLRLGPSSAMQKARHRSCRRRGQTFSAARTAAKYLTHVRKRIGFMGTIISTGAEIRLLGGATSLVTARANGALAIALLLARQEVARAYMVRLFPGYWPANRKP